MSTHPDLTIVIPAKNESRHLPILLESLSTQDYPQLAVTRVFVADASSTDRTPQIAYSFRGRLDILVIPGGLPSVGRNAGAALASTPYVLFIDADMELRDPTLLRRAVEKMKRKRLHCLTTSIACADGSWMDGALYRGNNFVQRLSGLATPFSTGMFMLFDRAEFHRLGGFNERALYAEDYLLSKKVSLSRFGIVRGEIFTTSRRFRKMGRLRILRMFLKTAVNTFNDSYFLRDQNYWREV